MRAARSTGQPERDALKTSTAHALIGFLTISLAHVALASEKVEKEIAERTMPVGVVCVEGDPCASAVTAGAASSEPRSGEEIYNKSCASCHATGVAGAPIFADAAQWVDRIAKGMDTLYANSINGINAMPPKGLCMDCSDEELNATVDYMVEAAK